MARRFRKKADGMTTRQQLVAIAGVAKLSFRSAPGAVVFKIVGSFITAVMPFVTTYYAALTTTALADAYSGDQAAGERAITYVIITAALGLFMTAWRSVDQYIQEKMRYIVEAQVTDRMYDQFLHLSFAQYDNKETADLYDKAQRFASFFAYVFDRIASLLTELITMVAGVAALLTVNVWLALAIMIAILPGVYLQIKLSREQIAHWNKNVDVRRIKGRIEWELLQPHSIAELRLYGIVRHLMKLREQLREKDVKQRLDFERSYVGKRLLADALEAATEVGALVWVVLQIIARETPIGQFVFVQQVVSRAIGGATGFVSQISSIDEDIANLVDYERFMALGRDNREGVMINATPETIRFDNVSFSYPSHPDKQVLRNISFTIHKHQRVAFVGENGAGKTSLIRILTGLYHPVSGSVFIDEHNLTNVDVDSWHRQLGVLQQDSTRFSFANVKDNIQYGDIEQKATKHTVIDALKEGEAYEFVEKLPAGIENYVDNWMEDEKGNKGTDLSGGQWQRLALARNFYRNAPIVILDEPTSAIDALAESRIFDRLFKKKDKTIITISHRLTTVKKAEIIYMLQVGQIIEQGTHAELVKKKGAYYHMFESQLHESER
jgi:ATP-binding cassette subfamily B protein/ATP-binding cassette subfamily C protein